MRKTDFNNPDTKTLIAIREPLLLSPSAVAALTQKSVRTIWRDHASGMLPEPVRAGRCLRWRWEDIRRWVDDGCPTRNQG
jgi:predicted DNA-binding transcriptional regulator AlpA